MSFKNIFRIVVMLLFAAFVVQNAEVVEIRFLVWSTYASRALVLICVFVLGLLAGWLPALFKGKRECPEDKEINS
ncbi:MAG: LapA family protein [Desulfatibacillum sp.]|nr:LapA family protein [Desulfatibacillum sp.]